MPKIQLIVYQQPGAASVILNIKRQGEGFLKREVTIDTGAEISLLPITYMDLVEYELTERGRFSVKQAGIARQSFDAYEAYLSVFLEDTKGNQTQEFKILVWFTEMDKTLIGFGGILEQAIFHLDMPNLSGYLEFADVPAA